MRRQAIVAPNLAVSKAMPAGTEMVRNEEASLSKRVASAPPNSIRCFVGAYRRESLVDPRVCSIVLSES
jgi:hypothetical protein